MALTKQIALQPGDKLLLGSNIVIPRDWGLEVTDGPYIEAIEPLTVSFTKDEG